jgi:hypothetical protein
MYVNYIQAKKMEEKEKRAREMQLMSVFLVIKFSCSKSFFLTCSCYKS